MNKWKWFAIGAIIMAAWFGGCRYGIHSVVKNTIIDTATSRVTLDTVFYPTPVVFLAHDTMYAKRRDNAPIDTVYMDSDPVTVYLPAETPEWVVDGINDWNATRTYDTAIARNGDTIRVGTTVNRNRVTRQSLNAIWNDTTITKTVVLKPPRRGVGYFTLSGGSSPTGNATAAIGFQFKTSGEKTYGVSYQRIFGTKQPYIMATIGLPIRLIPNFKK